MQMKRGTNAKGMRTFFASDRSATDAVSGLIGGGLSLPMLLAGLALGLILGLLIGWVLWPVEWSSARPTDLDPDAKAQYLAAVADSYAASQDTVAFQIAQRRLIGVDTAVEIPRAIAYFARGTQSEGAYQPPFEGSDAYGQFSATDGNIRINNLKQLAGVLGVEISNQVIPAPDVAPASDAPFSDESATESVDSTDIQADEGLVGLEGDASIAATPNSLLDNVSTVLGCLGGLILLFGGLTVIYYLQRRRGQNSPAEKQQAAPQTPVVGTVVDSAGGDGDRLDSNIDDDITGGREEKGAVEAFRTEAMEDGEYRFTDEFGNDGENALGEEFARPSTASFEGAGADSGFADEPYFGAVDDDLEPAPYAAPTPEGDSANGLIIDEFIASYQLGNLDYEEIHPIYASGSTDSIGEFGMGINTKSIMFMDNPEHAIAVDVWLFDKTNAENPNTQTLVFLSEYAAENSNLRESISAEEADGIAPVVPEPGARFRIDGENLFLLCEVIDVVFSPADPIGIFEELEVKLAVFAKRETD